MQYRRLTGRTVSRRGRIRPVPARVGEVLEERTLLTTFTVDTTVDESDGNFGAGDLSLREAIEQANANPGADMIRFAASLNNAIFNITQGPLPAITGNLQLLGTIGSAQSINGAGLLVNAAGAGTTTTLAINSVNINLEPAEAGLRINASNDGVANVTVFNSRITNSALQGIRFNAQTGGIVNLTLSAVQILSNGDVVQSEGILGRVGVDPAGAESLTSPGNFATANLDFNNIRVAGQNLEGFKLEVADGGQVTTPNAIRSSAFNDNGVGNQRSAVKFTVADAGSSLQANFSSTVADRSTGHGFEFRSTNAANLNVGVTNGQALQAKADAMNFTVDAATAVVSVNGFIGNNAHDNGVEVRLTNNANARFNQFDNVTLTMAVNTGLQIGTLSGSTLEAFNSTGVTASNNGGSGALLTTLGSTSNFAFTNLTTNTNQIRGVQVGVNETGTSTKTFNTLTATGNRSAHAMGVGVANTSVLNLAVNGGTMTTTGSTIASNVVFAPIRLGSTANLTFDGVNMNGSTSSGIVTSYDNNSQGTLNVANTTSTGNRLVGVAAFVNTGSDLDVNFNNVNVSNAGQQMPADGMRLEVVGAGATGDFTFNGVTADGATRTGISLLYNAGATGTVAAFNNVNARNTGLDGVNVNVRGNATQLSTFNASGVNVSGAGLGTNQSADGFDLTVAGPGAMGNFTLANLTANGAGGRGFKVQAENTATLGLNVNGFAANNNGLEGVAMDVGTVVGGAQLLGGVFANGSASSNGQAFMVDAAGIRTTVRKASTAGVAFNAVSANSNTSDGFDLSGTMGSMFTADLSNGVAALGNAQNGVDFLGDGAATTVSLTSAVPGNNFDGNGLSGVNVALTNGVTANEITVKGSASMNQGDGIRVIADDATGVTINTLQVTGTNPQLNGNQGNGLVMDLDSVNGITSLDLSSLTVNDNVLDQINVTLTNMTLTDVSLANINADGPGAGVGTGDGVELTLENSHITNSLGLNGINAVNNGEDGLQLNFLAGSTIPASSGIDLGTFDNNGQDGINLNVNASVIALNLTNSTFAMLGTVTTASNNGRHGLNVELNGATLTMGQVNRRTFSNNLGAGIRVQAAVPSTFNAAGAFTNNTISDNGSFGFRGIFNGGAFDIGIGQNGAGNMLTNNAGAGVAVDMVQNTVGRLRILNNTINGTNAGVGGVFNGEGIFIRQLGTVNPAQATNTLISGVGPGLLIQNNRIGVDALGAAAGNSSYGITFDSEEQSNISGLHIFDNIVSNNGNDGISLRRFDEVTVSDFRIEANTINANSGDGIELTGENDDNSAMQVVIGPDAPTAAQLTTDSATTPLPAAPARGNTITNNSGDGIRLQVNADAGLNVDMRGNTIVGNNDDGIGLSEVVLDASDARRVSGIWVQNTIANNGDRGVESSAVTFGTVRDPNGAIVTDIRNGISSAQGVFARANIIGAVLDQFGQVIAGRDGNGSTGIEINGGGSSTWINTTIIRNGRLVTGNRAVGHGIDIQQINKNVTLDNNLIRQNFQDGIEIAPASPLFIQVDMTRNRVQQNMGRGLDILTRNLADTRVNITNGMTTTGPTLAFSNGPAMLANNFFNSNLEEGIYQVITASNSQNQTDFAGTDLAQDGNVTNSFSTATLVIDNATVSNNGDPSVVGNLVASAGIVIRVGSQDAPNVLSTGPHFATNGNTTNPSFLNGGIFAQITNSTLQGNFGDDVFIHSYRSTGDPATIGGTWNDMMFAPTGTQNGDPLSRLDLVWGTSAAGNANTFDSVDLNNSLRRGTPDGQAGAYYDNAEGTFKSRLSNAMPPGPFSTNSASRRRNAQRAPARTYPGGFFLNPDPTMSPGGSFQYPGVGDSTFRVFAGGDTTVASQLDNVFFLDDFPAGGDFSPIESPFEANGVSFTGSQGSFEQPFGWGTF